MCSPTALTLTSVLGGAVNFGLQYAMIDAQQKAAAKGIEAAAEAAARKRDFDVSVALAKHVEARTKAALASEQTATAGAEAVGALRVRGLTGGSADRLAAGLAGRISRSRQLIGLNYDAAANAARVEGQAADTTYQNTIDTLPSAKVPGAGLQLAAGAISSIGQTAQIAAISGFSLPSFNLGGGGLDASYSPAAGQAAGSRTAFFDDLSFQ